MKTFHVLLLVSSWSSAQCCTLQTCTKSFALCPFNDEACRTLPTLDLSNKGFTGPVPSSFFTQFGQDINGDADTGKKKVLVQKVLLQGNQITSALKNIFDCATFKEVNLEGNPLTSNHDIKSMKIETLNLAKTLQTHVKWLSGKAPTMKSLNLANNLISDISPLATMTQLTTLDLTGNDQITDLTSLAALTKLKTLTVSPSLQKQAVVITSADSPQVKRERLLGAKISEIEAKSTGLGTQIGQFVEQQEAQKDTNQQQTATNEALETRLTSLEERIEALTTLENKFKTLNQACFAAQAPSQAQAPLPSRRRLDGCIDSDDGVDGANAVAASLISVAAAIMAMTLF